MNTHTIGGAHSFFVLPLNREPEHTCPDMPTYDLSVVDRRNSEAAEAYSKV